MNEWKNDGRRAATDALTEDEALHCNLWNQWQGKTEPTWQREVDMDGLDSRPVIDYIYPDQLEIFICCRGHLTFKHLPMIMPLTDLFLIFAVKVVQWQFDWIGHITN